MLLILPSEVNKSCAVTRRILRDRIIGGCNLELMLAALALTCRELQDARIETANHKAQRPPGEARSTTLIGYLRLQEYKAERL